MSSASIQKELDSNFDALMREYADDEIGELDGDMIDNPD